MKMKSSHDESNPRLKATFLQVVDNQLKANDPPETRQTLERLIAQGITREDLYRPGRLRRGFQCHEAQPAFRSCEICKKPPAASRRTARVRSAWKYVEY
jgi:hypothetical protein